MSFDVTRFQREIVLGVGDVVVFGGLATPLLLAVQQQWRVTSSVIAVILGIIVIAKQLYAGLTTPAVSESPSPSTGPTAAP